MGVLSGTLLIPSAKLDDAEGPAAVLDPDTGDVLTTIPSTSSLADDVVPYCENGAVAPNGNWAVAYEADGSESGHSLGIAFYDDDDKFIRADTSIFPSFISPFAYIAATTDSFWVLAFDRNSAGEDGSIYQFDFDGNLLFSAIGIVSLFRPDWPAENPSSHTIDGFAVSFDNTTMYMFDGTFAPAAVVVYHIDTDSWDSASLVSVASRRSDSVTLINALMLVGGGDTFILSLRPQFGSGALNRYLRLYDRLTGSAIGTERDLGVGGEPNEIGVLPTLTDAVYVKFTGSPLTTFTLYKVSPTDLTDLQPPATGDTLEGTGQVPASCPLLVFPGSFGSPSPSDDEDEEVATPGPYVWVHVPIRRYG